VKAMLVEFENPALLARGLEELSRAGISGVDTYTPMPVEESAPRSPLPLCMFVAGVLGFAGAFALMSYADVRAYPLDIGGRPEWAWPTFVPIAFELGVLCAMVAGFIGYFIICRMPRLYDPVDECTAIGRASRDGWFIHVRAQEPGAILSARRVLEPLQPTSVQEYAE